MTQKIHSANASARTVGAALRGRPWFAHKFKTRASSVFGVVFKPRAATEGRPYSTFRVENVSFGSCDYTSGFSILRDVVRRFGES